LTLKKLKEDCSYEAKNTFDGFSASGSPYGAEYTFETCCYKLESYVAGAAISAA